MTFIQEDVQIIIPGWVTDLEAFRRWAHSDEFPTVGRIWWLRGEVWIDMSKQQIFTHILVKTRFTRTLDLLAVETQAGIYLTDGVLLSNFAADISGNPDGMFISTATLESDRIRLLEGKEGGCVEVQGTPDMVLEIISDSSVDKDDVELREAYFTAKIPEYWIVDVRKDRCRFDILRRTAKGYTNTRKQGGWVRSAVFGRSFRLVVGVGPANTPSYELESR